MASMVNKYQWRRAWEAYYKRPLTNGEDHKPPDYKKEEADKKSIQRHKYHIVHFIYGATDYKLYTRYH